MTSISLRCSRWTPLPAIHGQLIPSISGHYGVVVTEYVEKMKGTDKDLGAHFTIISYRGETLYGKEIKDVFSTVSKEDYFDSIWYDIEGASTDILNDPMYIILNLCRVLAYAKDNLILSKLEGGRWGLLNTPERFQSLITAAMEEYQNATMVPLNEAIAEEYAAYMLAQIKNAVKGWQA